MIHVPGLVPGLNCGSRRPYPFPPSENSICVAADRLRIGSAILLSLLDRGMAEDFLKHREFSSRFEVAAGECVTGHVDVKS